MSDEKLGNGGCYICGYPLDPLRSVCPKCGYSQLPRPDGEAPRSLKKSQKDLRADLKAKLDKARSGYKSPLKKK